MIYMTHNEWFARITGGASGAAAAAKAEIPVASLNRHLAAGQLTPAEVIALCRAYDTSPVEGLAATGHLTSEEATGVPADAIAELLSDQDLIRTLAYRVNTDPAVWFGTFGELAEGAEESQGRSNTHLRAVDPMPYDAVADSSPDEDALRAQEEGDVD